MYQVAAGNARVEDLHALERSLRRTKVGFLFAAVVFLVALIGIATKWPTGDGVDRAVVGLTVASALLLVFVVILWRVEVALKTVLDRLS